MREIGEIPAPDALARYLRTFPLNAQRDGEGLFNRDAVAGLRVATPGFLFEAKVQARSEYRVRLICDAPRGVWNGDCTCGESGKCYHVYAAGKALLAEHSVCLVNGLSAGTRIAAPNVEALPESELARRLVAKVGRALTAEEVHYIKTVHRAFLRSRITGTLGEVDLRELGLRGNIYPWDLQQLWPEPPKDDYHFWLYAVRALKQRNARIPAFMEPVSDLSDLESMLATAMRTRLVQDWRDKMDRVQVPLPAANEKSEGGWDFRIAFGSQTAWLECKRPQKAEFERPKAWAMRDLMVQDPLAVAALPPEAERVWQAFNFRLAHYNPSIELRYDWQDDCSELLRVIGKPSLASRTVDASGKPLERVAAPLRWTLHEPADGQQDYKLRLTQADGQPAPRFLFKGGLNPVICVSEHAVFLAPPIPSILDTPACTAIPARAVESAEGVRFLQRMGVQLPDRIQQRIQTIAVKASILCRLGRDRIGRELCIFEAGAASEDGAIAWKWVGHGWAKTRLQPAHLVDEEGGPIRCYDEKVLQQVKDLLQPLRLRAGDDRHLQLRVKKDFPSLLADWLRSVPPHISVRLEGELASLAEATISGRVRLDVTEAEIDWFDLRVVLDVSDAELTPQEIKLLLNARGAFVRLEGKGWKRLQFDFTPEDDEQLARLGLSARELSGEPHRLHALQLADPAARHFLPQEKTEQIQRRLEEIKVRVAPELPAAVQAELRPYQREGFHFLAYLAENGFGGILADDMGLGKTVQALAWLAWLRGRWQESESTPAPPALVVCPKSVMDNWRAEAIKFTPGIRVQTWAAHELPSVVERLAEADLHVINYAQVRIGRPKLSQVQWLAAILDEGQYIKNPNSLTAQAARNLQARYKLVLSGTPIENRLLDLWSLMQFAMPGVLGTRAYFARIYSAEGDPFARRRLAARVRPFLLRRTKAQVAKDLPARIEEDLYCEIEGEQLALYRAELKRAQQILLGLKTQKELAQFQFHFLTALLRLRQICCHPRLYHADAESDGAKREALLDQLEPLMDEGHKVLVFSQFVELLELLKPALDQRGWPVFCLTGATENRGELVSRFQQFEGAAVFLISLKAGGFGLNLTSASYVVLFDPWWNPAVENQAIDRTHRIGQTSTVIAYRLLIKNSIEEKIRQLQRKKAALSEDVLGEEKFAQNLTLEDLHFLLAD